MDERTKKIGIVILILLVIAIIALIVLRQKPTPETVTTPTTETLTTENSAGKIPETLQPGVTPPTTEQRNELRFAMQFAERYGSFSSETSFQNLKDLKPVMTTKMQGSVDAFIAVQEVAKEFYGVTTQAISGSVTDKTDTKATVLVATQRTETKGTSTAASFAQDIKIELIKVGTDWKVDAAEWVAKK